MSGAQPHGRAIGRIACGELVLSVHDHRAERDSDGDYICCTLVNPQSTPALRIAGMFWVAPSWAADLRALADLIDAAPEAERMSLTDQQLLCALDWRDNDGLTAAQIAARLGTSRGAVCGALSRVDKDVARTDRAGLGNGTMPRRWWAGGSSGRRRAS